MRRQLLIFFMTIKDKYTLVLGELEKLYPDAQTELNYSNPYELLVAVVLSAQCTDKRVNLTTPALFERFPEPADLALADVEEIFAYIRSISYPNNKAKHLKGLGQMIMEEFQGNIPDNMEDLQKLPGVGRKTANVIMSVVYETPNMAVDTHVFRVSERIGLTKNAKNPLQCEQQLVRHIPAEKIYKAHHWLILHGRYVCVARKPKCSSCSLKSYCNYYKKELR